VVQGEEQVGSHNEEHVRRRYIICPLSLYVLILGEFHPMN
jgi:hypothetical protein